VKAPRKLLGFLPVDRRLGVRRTRNREKDNLLICPFFGSIIVLGNAARGDVTLFVGVGNVARREAQM
jgi:hypothetical protein